MKRITYIILFSMLTVPLISIAQLQKPNPKLSIVTGTWKTKTVSQEVCIYAISNGAAEKLSTYKLGKDKRFSLAFVNEKAGFYVVGQGWEYSPESKYIFYLKPGDNLNIDVNDSTYVLSGVNTKENQAMAKWKDRMQKLEQQTKKTSAEPGVFMKVVDQAAAPFIAAPTGNKTFDRDFVDFRKFNLMSKALWAFLNADISPKGSSSYFSKLSYDDIGANTAILKYPFSNWLPSLLVTVVDQVKGITITPGVDEKVMAMKNDTIKGKVFLENLLDLKDYPTFVNLKDKYAKYVITQDQKEQFNKETKRIFGLYNQTSVGKPAINFTHKDKNGKDVSLSDFKGKAVFVDVWATWCIPCKAEMPYLKKIEEQYHGKDIVFMGVSIDGQKDLQKWKDFVESNQLPGVQLIGNRAIDSDIARFYQIEYVPRFMLFDKNGNVVSVNAPRPSSKELPALLDKVLAQ